MQRRMLACMASFYSEQQSLDVRERLARRVQSGLCVGKPPFGYRNIRINGRSIVEINPQSAAVVRRAFELYAHHNHKLDTLSDALLAAGVLYCPSIPRFPRSKLHTLLTDRAYIGEIKHQGHWLRGTHQPIVERAT